MVDTVRRTLLGLSLLPVSFSSGCLEMFGRDDTVKVSNESDESHTLTLRFVDRTVGSVVSEREMTLQPDAEKRYKVHLSNAGHESSHYVVTATTESGLRRNYDLGEGVFYTMDVTITAEGVEISHTIR